MEHSELHSLSAFGRFRIGDVGFARSAREPTRRRWLSLRKGRWIGNQSPTTEKLRIPPIRGASRASIAQHSVPGAATPPLPNDGPRSLSRSQRGVTPALQVLPGGPPPQDRPILLDTTASPRPFGKKENPASAGGHGVHPVPRARRDDHHAHLGPLEVAHVNEIPPVPRQDDLADKRVPALRGPARLPPNPPEGRVVHGKHDQGAADELPWRAEPLPPVLPRPVCRHLPHSSRRLLRLRVAEPLAALPARPAQAPRARGGAAPLPRGRREGRRGRGGCRRGGETAAQDRLGRGRWSARQLHVDDGDAVHPRREGPVRQARQPPAHKGGQARPSGQAGRRLPADGHAQAHARPPPPLLDRPAPRGAPDLVELPRVLPLVLLRQSPRAAVPLRRGRRPLHGLLLLGLRDRPRALLRHWGLGQEAHREGARGRVQADAPGVPLQRDFQLAHGAGAALARRDRQQDDGHVPPRRAAPRHQGERVARSPWRRGGHGLHRQGEAGEPGHGHLLSGLERGGDVRTGSDRRARWRGLFVGPGGLDVGVIRSWRNKDVFGLGAVKLIRSLKYTCFLVSWC